ncbi:hypothetical protein N7G274_002139 [Stereocaulon virgatum]|uniref:Uncharacterized protein n=1 Tax=Stereocaulon virgatum TaxID=373712 RepID=A0ABR4AKU0_9LECA
MALVLLHSKGPMPLTDPDVPAFAGSATHFEVSPPALALPLPNGFEPTHDVKHAICLVILKCIEKLPSNTSAKMKKNLYSSTDFVNWTLSPSPETDDARAAFSLELINCLDSLPSNIHEIMLSYLSSCSELMTELGEHFVLPTSTLSLNPEDVPEIILAKLFEYRATLPSATSEVICTGIMNYLESIRYDDFFDLEAFRQAVCKELIKCVNSLPSPTGEEMATSLLSQTELMRYLKAPLQMTPSSISRTTQHTETTASRSTSPQQVPQQVDHNEKEVEITEEEQREMVAIAEAELENSTRSSSPTQIWEQCAAKRAQTPPQQHDDQPPTSPATKVDKYGREQPPLNATPSEVWGARAKANSPPQTNERQSPETELRGVDKYGNPQPNRSTTPTEIWRAKTKCESPPKNNSRQCWRTETPRKDKYGRVQPPTNATPAQIWGAKAKPRRVTA